ncbi:hypothetical protein K488DRAFT_74875 [Vararia minispora EC-137]|uniref:Uncharacterized protein n=1 Tax=Vararia minispora EC-137 TaxID=1314806 RepID=A0ACB8Q5U1_9AGAM|nr:hypothetical protein K488DRAFT_74875 [Vararia minispora EC-137]
MSRATVDEWTALTLQMTASLELRQLSGGGWDQPLATGIETTLALLSALRAALKAGKNVSQKECTARVPKEVFDKILKYAMTQAPIAVRSGGVADLGWVKLSHVCRAWRYFALSNEEAWTSSVGQLPRATTVFQERAGSSPIDVIIAGDRPLLLSQPQAFSPADEGSVSIILEDLDFAQVRSLVLTDGHARAYPYAKKLSSQSPQTLSRLSDLSLFLTSGRCRLKATNLKTLKLRNCFMGLCYWSLTSVDIEYDGWLLPQPRASTVTTALLGCRALVNLRLHNCLCPVAADEVAQAQWQANDLDITELLALECLSLKGPAHSLEGLLLLLWFPPEAVIHMDACVSSDGAPDIMRLLARACHGSLSQDFVTVSIDHDNRFSQQLTRVRMWKEASMVDLFPAIRFGWSSKVLSPSPHFDVTLKSDSVKSLALTLPSSEYSAEAVRGWVEILERFPKLAALFPKHQVLRALDVFEPGAEHRMRAVVSNLSAA